MCTTKGQWLHMKTTTRAGLPAKSSRDTVLPWTFGSEKGGAFVPSGNIVLAVLTIVGLRGKSQLAWGSRVTRRAVYRGRTPVASGDRGTFAPSLASNGLC